MFQLLSTYRVGAANYDECVNYGYDARNWLILYHLLIRISKSNVSLHNMDIKYSWSECEWVKLLIPRFISELSLQGLWNNRFIFEKKKSFSNIKQTSKFTIIFFI